MLAVVYGLVGPLLQKRNGPSDHVKILIKVNLHDVSWMNIPRLSKNGHHGSVHLEEGFDRRIFFGSNTGPASAAKSCNSCMFQGNPTDLLKELRVFGVCPRPSPFNVVHAEFVEFACDSNLVFN